MNAIPDSQPRRALLILCSVAALLLPAAAALAQKPPQRIQSYLMAQVEISVDPLPIETADELLTETLWWVGVKTPVGPGESFLIMAVKDGEVLRIRRHALRGSNEGFVRLLPADFRVRSEADARRLIEAAAAINIDAFGEPERPDVPVADMRINERDGAYLFVDGERFGKATGYRLTLDESGRVTALEYSWELDTAPLEEQN